MAEDVRAHGVPLSPPGERGDALRGGLAIALLGVLALALRLYQLGAESIWNDEAFSLRDAHNIVAFNRMRPLYYLILRFWMQFGQSEAWLRLPAVLFGTGAVLLLYPVARRLADRRTAILACLMMAVTATELDHSQEIRMYTLASLLVLATVYFLLRWYDTRSPAALAAHIISAGAALATTPMTLMAIVLGVAFALYAVRGERRALVALAGAYGVLLLAWLPLALWARKAVRHIEGTYEAPGLYKLLTAPAHMLTDHIGFWENHPGQRIVLALFVLTCFGLVLAAARHPDRRTVAVHARMVAAWLFGAILVTYILNVVRLPQWTPRYFHPMAPGLYLLMAMGIWSLWDAARPVGAIAGGFLLGAMLYCTWIYYPSSLRQDSRGAARWVQHQALPRDAVALIHPDDSTHVMWQYYYRGAASVHDLTPPLTPGQRADDRTIAEMLAQMPPGKRRWWLVMLGVRPSLFRVGFYSQLEAYIDRVYPSRRRYTSVGVEVIDLDPAEGARRPSAAKR